MSRARSSSDRRRLPRSQTHHRNEGIAGVATSVHAFLAFERVARLVADVGDAERAGGDADEPGSPLEKMIGFCRY